MDEHVLQRMTQDLVIKQGEAQKTQTLATQQAQVVASQQAMVTQKCHSMA